VKENIVIRDGLHFNLRVNDTWHKHQTWDDARWIFIRANLDPYEMFASAITEPEPFEIEYRPKGRHRWWFNEHPVPVKCIKYMLSESGCSKEVVDAIIHAHKLAYEVEQKCRQM